MDQERDYIGDGRRARFEPNAASSSWLRFVWDEENVLQETDNSGVLVAQYTDDPGTWGGLISERRSSATSYYGFDQRGHSRILMNGTGGIIATYSEWADQSEVLWL